MKKWRIDYTPEFKPGPLSFWVHKSSGGDSWLAVKEYAPSLPTVVPGKGFPRLSVNVMGIELEFASVPEVEHFLDVIRQKNMPTTLQLTQKRGVACGPNSHWLSRLPSKIKPWVKRAKIIPIIEEGLSEYKILFR